ncbi:MAG TPA: 23S rRNA (pseudouridine(1915)-N(3))-methyltransferase RlmH [bacterium]|nr:23S rRNA (pseudouridine(1915)-N(3))-methyltransferase RlmH [bacterium]
MRLTVIAIGKPRAPWAIAALEHYTRFLSKYTDVRFAWLKPAPASLENTGAIVRHEGDRILAHLTAEPGFAIACDKAGRSFTSETFAARLQKGIDAHGGRVCIIIGGAWGLDPRVQEAAHLAWSFGPLTFPHELALVTACEQTARALSILRGEGYHK